MKNYHAGWQVGAAIGWGIQSGRVAEAVVDVRHVGLTVAIFREESMSRFA
jgi:hypothetical protein